MTRLTADSAAFDALYTANSGRRFAEHTPGRDVDDVAVAALPHARREAADQPQRRVVVERHRALDVVPAFERIGQRPANRPAGVVDQDVDAAEVVLDRGHELVDGVEIGQVAGVGAGRRRHAAVIRLDELVQQLLTARDHHDGRAAAGELLGGGLADARRRAGQQNPLAPRSISSRSGRWSNNCWPSGGRMLASTTWSANRRSGLLLTSRQCREVATVHRSEVGRSLSVHSDFAEQGFGLLVTLKRCGAALTLAAAATLVSRHAVMTATRPRRRTNPTRSRWTAAARMTLKASGSTAQSNAMTQFVTAFEAACEGQKLTYTPNGSGEGVRQFIDGKTDFGGTDSPMSADEATKAQERCGGSDAWHLPVVFGRWR